MHPEDTPPVGADGRDSVRIGVLAGVRKVHEEAVSWFFTRGRRRGLQPPAQRAAQPHEKERLTLLGGDAVFAGILGAVEGGIGVGHELQRHVRVLGEDGQANAERGPELDAVLLTPADGQNT